MLQAGQVIEARDLLKKVCQKERSDSEAQFMLGIANGMLGDHAAAEKAFRQVLKLFPNHPDANNNLGLSLESQGRSSDALDYLAQAVKLSPDNPEFAFNYANSLESLGQLKQAGDWYEKAISMYPEYAEAYCNLGNVLQKKGEYKQAVAAFEKAISLSNDYSQNYTDIYINLGNALMELGLGESALQAYKKAVKLQPEYASGYLALGNAYLQMGQNSEAAEALRHAIELKPEFGSAYLNLVQTRRFDMRDVDVETMEALYRRDKLAEQDKIELAFALGKVYADLKLDDQSFEYYRQGNALKRASMEHSVEQDRQYFSAIKQTISADFLQQHASVSCSDATPIFIVGMPRSGTSLTEQILASHSQVHGAGELNDLKIVIEQACETRGRVFPNGLGDLNDQELLRIGETYLARLHAYAPDAQRITDKMPHNFLYLGVIHKLFPRAKIIHCQRNPMDNALSIFKTLFTASTNSHPYAYDLIELGQYYRLYQDLMAYWRELLPEKFYELCYEDLVSDQEVQTRRLLEYCGLPWEEACLAFHRTSRVVRTASLAQVRQPMHTNAVEAWRRFEQELQPFIQALQA